MYNHEAPAHRKLILRSLLICWLIILGGYLLIRMVFLVFGLQLHLTAQGICLALLPYCFGALYLWKRCKKQKPLRCTGKIDSELILNLVYIRNVSIQINQCTVCIGAEKT